MYIAPSSGHEWLNFKLSSKMILRRFGDVFFMSGVRMLHFLKRFMEIQSNPWILHYGFKCDCLWNNIAMVVATDTQSTIDCKCHETGIRLELYS